MTNEQAIECLKGLKWFWSRKIDGDFVYVETLQQIQALDMAIEALQHDCEKVAESSDDYITIKRQFVLDAIDIGLSGYITDDDKLTLEGMGIAVSEMPSAQPEIIRCENCAKRDDDEWEDMEKVYWCDIMDGCVKADDYCSYAERRVGDSDD